MNVRRQLALSLLLVGMLLETGCQKKTAQTVPPHGQAPTIAVVLPPKIPEVPTPTPPPPHKQEQPELPAPKEKTQAHHGHSKRTPPQTPANQPAADSAPGNQTPAGSGGPSTAVPSGGSTVAAAKPPASPAGEGNVDVAIAPQVSNAQANQQKETAVQMLDATEKNLKALKPDLSKDQQAMVNQINSYIAQSKKALSDNDFERAANLATKARLLSDALVQK